MGEASGLWGMLMEMPVIARTGIAGLIIGSLLGVVMQRTHFCTMGSLSDINAMGDWRRFRAWVLAMAVAILLTQTMQYTGYIDVKESIYLGSTFNWLAFIIGGLVFGVGMVFASGCGAKNLIRVGGGDLKGFVVVIVVGVTAYMTLRGLIAPVRVFLNDMGSVDMTDIGGSTGLHSLIGAFTGMADAPALIAGTFLLAVPMLVFCFMNKDFRSSPRNIIAGLAIGVLVAAAWWATGVLGYDDFEPAPLFALNFVSPVGNMLQYLMTWTGSTISFGVTTVFGMILGSFIASLIGGEFKINGFADTNDLIRHLLGGVMMGAGAVTSLGCTVGQGISGFSTLALGSLIALLAIIGGGFLGFKALERGFLL